MIDFKKKLRAEKDVKLVVTGAAQLMFNIADNTKAPEQMEMIACQCCGHTWTSSEADTIKKAWKQKGIPPGLGPLCDICWHLYCVSQAAHRQRKSLKTAIHGFVKGRAKQLHRDFLTVWTEKND